MELIVTSREGKKKSEAKRIRREGNIPAILYSRGQESKKIVIDGVLFNKFLRKMVPGTLASQIFTLNFEGKSMRTLVKDVQYKITTYDVIHLDFDELVDGKYVTLNVPIRCVGVADCVGVKLGGVLRQSIRFIRIRVLPKNIPSHFELNVSNLDIAETIKLSTIELPSDASAISDLKEVAVVVARR